MKKTSICIITMLSILMSGCEAEAPSNDISTGSGTNQQTAASTMQSSITGDNTDMNEAPNTKELLTFDERRDGTSSDTVATPDDFPEEYNYGSGKISDWDQGYASKRMPEPEGNQTVLNTAADPT
ncbi:MAG: hypothetical protein NC203_11050 [Firmicutes bacterium]|nr:hypothetical protein [[Eubacterium] siraeum]MCM1488891.1 hypothetical protein [Bacillota bacterium]